MKSKNKELVSGLPIKKVKDAIAELIDKEIELRASTDPAAGLYLSNFWTMLLNEYTKDEILAFDDNKLRIILAAGVSIDEEIDRLIQGNLDPNGVRVNRMAVNKDHIEKNSLKIVKK